jgi:hypothetical protein
MLHNGLRTLGGGVAWIRGHSEGSEPMRSPSKAEVCVEDLVGKKKTLFKVTEPSSTVQKVCVLSV